jgi:hypothetical protein
VTAVVLLQVAAVALTAAAGAWMALGGDRA